VIAERRIVDWWTKPKPKKKKDSDINPARYHTTVHEEKKNKDSKAKKDHKSGVKKKICTGRNSQYRQKQSSI
jgi:hypothetical protein